jgi:hypothetical protein
VSETAVRWLAHQPPNLERAKPLSGRTISDGKRAADILNRIRDFPKKAVAQKRDTEINEAMLEIMTLARAAASGGPLWAAPNEPRGAVFCMMLAVGEKSLESPKPWDA